MNTRTIDTDRVKETIDLRDLAAQYTTLHRASGAKELCGPCPRAGCTAQNDGFYCQSDFFACRKCHPDRGDAFEFMQWLHGVTFKEAHAMLTGGSMPAPTQRRTPERPQHPAQEWDADAATQKLIQAQRALWDSASTEAHTYLLGRGLDANTWATYQLGYLADVPLPGTWSGRSKPRSYPCQPAIVIPWFAGKQLVGLRYRFLKSHTYKDVDGRGREEKQSSLFGSVFSGHVFGGQAMHYHHAPERGQPDVLQQRTLVICEGEINCMSIQQVAYETRLDVLSLGSENHKLPPSAVDYAKRYRTVIIWTDREGIARELQAVIPRAHAITSDSCVGQDANDLLQANNLGWYLSTWRADIAEKMGRAAQEALYFDLWEAARAWHRVDSGTLEVMHMIGSRLGMQL